MSAADPSSGGLLPFLAFGTEEIDKFDGFFLSEEESEEEEYQSREHGLATPWPRTQHASPGNTRDNWSEKTPVRSIREGSGQRDRKKKRTPTPQKHGDIDCTSTNMVHCAQATVKDQGVCLYSRHVIDQEGVHSIVEGTVETLETIHRLAVSAAASLPPSSLALCARQIEEIAHQAEATASLLSLVKAESGHGKNALSVVSEAMELQKTVRDQAVLIRTQQAALQQANTNNRRLRNAVARLETCLVALASKNTLLEAQQFAQDQRSYKEEAVPQDEAPAVGAQVERSSAQWNQLFTKYKEATNELAYVKKEVDTKMRQTRMKADRLVSKEKQKRAEERQEWEQRHSKLHARNGKLESENTRLKKQLEQLRRRERVLSSKHRAAEGPLASLLRKGRPSGQ